MNNQGLFKNVESFDWDEYNSEKNWIKHKVKIEECQEVFLNFPLLTREDEFHSKIEKRFYALGKTKNLRL